MNAKNNAQLQYKNRLRDRQASFQSEELVRGILAHDRLALASALTLLESNKAEHIKLMDEVIEKILPFTRNSLRIGITGVPGVGKSTFIEALAREVFQNEENKLAVLSIDPSSPISKGSILGDKTRMNELSLHPNAFVRPSPSSSHLGGVNRSTRESILLCEAAGYNIVLVETVGVGQSETAVHAMTDFFLLLMLAGAGDQLQGIKRGIMELTDAMVITKADGGNELKADRAKGEYTSALHLFPQRENNWMPQVFTTSSLEAKGIDVVWKEIDKFNRWSISNGWKEENRKRQLISSFEEQIQNVLLHQLQNKPNFKEKYESTLNRVVSKELSAHRAAESFIALFFSA